MLLDLDKIKRGLMDPRFTVIEISKHTGLSRQGVYNLKENQLEDARLSTLLLIQTFLDDHDFK